MKVLQQKKSRKAFRQVSHTDVHVDTTHFTASLLGCCLNQYTNASHTSLSDVMTGLLRVFFNSQEMQKSCNNKSGLDAGYLSTSHPIVFSWY
jgi:hypothetical protein